VVYLEYAGWLTGIPYYQQFVEFPGHLLISANLSFDPSLQVCHPSCSPGTLPAPQSPVLQVWDPSCSSGTFPASQSPVLRACDPFTTPLSPVLRAWDPFTTPLSPVLRACDPFLHLKHPPCTPGACPRIHFNYKLLMIN
jgi:hypothetical protein